MERKDKNTELQSSYDEIPYQSNSFPQTHPDRLATLGHLFGLTTTPVTRCRVLELGCASGGNLIPIAYNLPGSEFVGVDLSRRQVEEAQTTISDLGLENIRIEHSSIGDIDNTWGNFDYIICHGVYSWVNDQIKDKILSVASTNLAHQGVAYVSYNTYPGWHIREMIRNMMSYHVGQFDETSERLEQGRALIDFLASSSASNGYYGSMLRSELDLIKHVQDWYLFHDHLEEVNTPLYFHQFNSRAEANGLRYLGEAEFSAMLTSGFPAEVAKTLDQISPNIIRAEQYMDFLRNRFFRQTLLCHSGETLDRNLGIEQLEGLLISSAVSPESSSVDLSPGASQSFRTPAGTVLHTEAPLTKAAFCVLSEYWPRAMDQSTLFQQASKLLSKQLSGYNAKKAWNTVLADLLHCYTIKAVEFHTWQAEFAENTSTLPKASKLAAYQLSRGLPIVNQRHETIHLDALGKTLLAGLDGTRDREALIGYLEKRVEDGTISVHREEQPITDGAVVNEALRQSLDQTLPKLARAALLVG